MTEIKINSLAKLYAILLLSEGPKHGYELIKSLQLKIRREISASQVYPFLKLLRKNKLIELEGKGKREKKTYCLTKKGKVFVRNMLTRFGELIDITIKPRLTTCTHCGCEVYKGGYLTEIRKKKMKFCCVHCARAYEGQK